MILIFFSFVFQPKATRAGDEKHRKKSPWPYIEVSRFVSKSTACAFTACEHVDRSRTCFIACHGDVHSTFNMQASVIVAELDRAHASLCKRVPRGSELAGCSSLGAVRAGHFGAKR